MKSLLSITASHKAIHEDWQTVLDSGVFTEGPFIRKLEEAVEDFYGYPAIALNSAGTALYATIQAYNFGLGCSVFAPVNTFFATGAMAIEAGCIPILVDASMTTFSMSYDHLKDLGRFEIAKRAKAVIYTPVGGALFPQQYMDAAALAAQRGTAFITDAAHGLGIGRGHFGKYGPVIFSLYPTKAVPSGEGGIVIGRNPDFLGEIKDWGNYGKYKDPFSENPNQIKYKRGFNFRMDEWSAVVAYHQIKAIPEILEKRSEVASKLNQICQPMVYPGETYTNWYRYIVPTGFHAKKTVGKVYARSDQLDQALKNAEIAPFHQDSYKTAAWIAENHQCLPLHEKMASWSVADIEKFITTDWEGPSD